MRLQLGKILIPLSQIPLKNVLIPRSRRQDPRRPGQRPDAALVPGELAHHLVLGDVPDLHEAGIRAHGEVAAALAPADGGHAVARAEVVQLRHFRVGGRPNVHAGGKAHGEVVAGTPVDEVQVEVVLESRGVEDLEGDFGDLSLLLLRDYYFFLVETLNWRLQKCVLERILNWKLKVRVLLRNAER